MELIHAQLASNYPNLTKDHFNKIDIMIPISIFFLFIFCGINCKICFSYSPRCPKIDLEKPSINQSKIIGKKSKSKQQPNVEVKSPSEVNNKTFDEINISNKDCPNQHSQEKFKSNKSRKKETKIPQKLNEIWIEIFLGKNNVPPILFVNMIDLELNTEFIQFLSTLNQKNFGYIFAIDNMLMCYDVTLRYSQQWSYTRKIHKEQEYFIKMLDICGPNDLKKDEECFLTEYLVNNYLRPKTNSEIKLHPIFISEKDILKYQGLIPDCQIAYLMNDQRVFYRRDVVDLHTSSKWLQYGMQIKYNEQPYKIVKSIAKRNHSSDVNEDQTTSLYGSWQVECYVPPICKDGIVPKNEYGNVYLFFPHMLPLNTVHIRLPKIIRIAIRLKIDYAPAMIGWSITGRHSHPLINGIVVASENYNELIKNWKKSIRRQNTICLIKNYSSLINEWQKLFLAIKNANKIQKMYSLV